MNNIEPEGSAIMERKYYIDFLKTFGILLLILAHVQAPDIVENIRCFDVPLLVFLSGILVPNSYNKSGNASKYFWKRIERLVFPSWLFLTGFYVCMLAVHQLPDISTILKSFLFQRDSGIVGGVWIILIYLWCAVLTPILQKIARMRHCWLLISFFIILYEVLIYVPGLVDNRFFYYTLFSAVPYGIFMLLGIKYDTLSAKEKLKLFIVGLGLLIFSSVVLFVRYGELQSPADYKYPAQLYFFSYSLPIIITLIELCKKLEPCMKKFSLVQFMSRHSLWIYLWQIFFLAVFNYVLCVSSWILTYLGIVCFSVLFTWIQNLSIEKISRKKNFYIFKYLSC